LPELEKASSTLLSFSNILFLSFRELFLTRGILNFDVNVNRGGQNR